ncbi:Dephospho-CoA kinase [uncultured Gammaproteobacteria bacterium]
MIILGLTGSIGMGKSTAAAMLRRQSIPVHDSDAAVHRLFAQGGAAVVPVETAFPGVVQNGAIDRALLGAKVLGNPPALRRLEAIVHPLVRLAQRRFLAQAARRRVPLVVLDIPLLYETHAEARVDAVIVVSAPALVQRQRVLCRPGMTPAKMAAILARQVPDRIKRTRADFVVATGLGWLLTLRALRRVVAKMKGRKGRHWPERRVRG